MASARNHPPAPGPARHIAMHSRKGDRPFRRDEAHFCRLLRSAVKGTTKADRCGLVSSLWIVATKMRSAPNLRANQSLDCLKIGLLHSRGCLPPPGTRRHQVLDRQNRILAALLGNIARSLPIASSVDAAAPCSFCGVLVGIGVEGSAAVAMPQRRSHRTGARQLAAHDW